MRTAAEPSRSYPGLKETGRVCIYYRCPPETDRWVPGDRHVRPYIRRILRGKPRMGGVDKVFGNLRLGLDRLGVPYEVNLPFESLHDDDMVGVIGRGSYGLENYKRPNRIVGGPGLMTHPSEWPTLFEDYPMAFYCQHSEWAAQVYRRYYGSRVRVWPVGIDTGRWSPSGGPKDLDVLIYDKIHWDMVLRERFAGAVQNALQRRGLTSVRLVYGTYREEDFQALLFRARAMVFLSEHESQGLACQECLASDVPVFAWDQGRCLDPDRYLAWNDPEIATTSVPYFDERCGERFVTMAEFEQKFDAFWEGVREKRYQPRAYVLANLTLEACAQRYLDLLQEAKRG